MRSINEMPHTDYDAEQIKIPSFMVSNRQRHVKRKGIHIDMDAYELMCFIGIIALVYCIGLIEYHPVAAIFGIVASVIAIIVGGNHIDNH